ncbi:MAG TPA: hypothetical protein VLX09_08650 [Stellaceae bacterium]|nr:hypothetical protein [Stellaceae bacterium]
MRKVLLALGVAPLMAGTAMAGQPLTDNQMDGVTAGFAAFSTSDAQALGKIVASVTATVAQVAVVTTSSGHPVTATYGETTLTLFKSIAGAQAASSASNTLPTTSLGLSNPSLPAG